jgi:uncharacterized membrane protein
MDAVEESGVYGGGGAGVCVAKLFAYDLRALATFDRILSFFALGLILVGVSWLYTRFRSQIQRYL